VDQRLLGLHNNLFDRMQLLGNVEARPLYFDHVDDTAEVTFCAAQALDDLGMTLVDECLFMNDDPILLGGHKQQNDR